ncbi:MAG: carboxypeptidase-like regulatory domain-containing protein [Cyclobacteriaceae bacterium]
MSQELTGSVIDKQTREPVSFANIFFANTLTGTTSDLDGNFRLTGFEAGKYDLVVSFVGYEDAVIPLDFEAGQKRELLVELKTDLIELPEFYLNADTAGRRYNMLSFVELFLGTTPNSQQVKILNPDVIFLYYDIEEEVLYAHSKEPLEIDNQALGYTITYLMKDFRMNYKTGEFFSFGIPAFKEKQPKSKKEMKIWIRNREEAYNGSKTHFFKSLSSDSLSENLFATRQLYRNPNPNRPPDEVINSEWRRLQRLFREELKKNTNGDIQVSIGGDISLNSSGSVFRDSLDYWKRMRQLPYYVDSLGMGIQKKEDLVKDNQTIYTGLLQVQYTGEKEELTYAKRKGREQRDSKQTSVIHFLDLLTIYPNGYYEDIRNVFIEGYWSWSSSMSELLPLDYEPAE